MPDYVLHPITERALRQFAAQPAHAVLITGSPGIGKTTVARSMAAQVLAIAHDALDTYPYITFVQSDDGKAIPIDKIRELQRFMTLKIPGTNTIARVAVIENAHLMTTEAQNALLKTLEEPPLDTIIILTAGSPEALLQTIQSRVRVVSVLAPPLDAIQAHFETQGHSAAHIDRAVMLSGGLPGLMHALLTDEEGHPLLEATETARTILRATSYERLALVDPLSKQKQACIDVLYILGQMAHMALRRSTDEAHAPAAKRWRRIMKAAYEARVQLQHNTQPKLVLTNLMLQLA